MPHPSAAARRHQPDTLAVLGRVTGIGSDGQVGSELVNEARGASHAAVMSTGLSRARAPSSTACCSGLPSSRSLRMNISITRPLSTVTPDKAMKPSAAEMDSGIPRPQERQHATGQGEGNARVPHWPLGGLEGAPGSRCLDACSTKHLIDLGAAITVDVEATPARAPKKSMRPGPSSKASGNCLP